MLGFPLALLFGVIGLRYDRRKVLALICTLVASGFLAFYLWVVGVSLFCR